ncbi:hypothetical protein HNQ07_004092 [Deinococcus metalli]|uniref:Uncharacterized protein n=1 Tax=Deinococcus metalli TaxID=1141878 RepID=A0A7W8KIM5_9DEIO|nr:hypothetical protein [Deinococcus metalli]MBB5378585.1 hypothetical protein [Deinococcus metalli]GHF58808.1 hypothetical protein GCM10017781_38890 [Deinococcus metalli]
MPKPNPKTDLSGLLGAATRAKDIERPRIEDETPVPQNTATPEFQERRVNVAVRESVHKPLRLYSVKSGRQVRDLVEEAVERYLKDVGEL